MKPHLSEPNTPDCRPSHPSTSLTPPHKVIQLESIENARIARSLDPSTFWLSPPLFVTALTCMELTLELISTVVTPTLARKIQRDPLLNTASLVHFSTRAYAAVLVGAVAVAAISAPCMWRGGSAEGFGVQECTLSSCLCLNATLNLTEDQRGKSHTTVSPPPMSHTPICSNCAHAQFVPMCHNPHLLPNVTGIDGLIEGFAVEGLRCDEVSSPLPCLLQTLHCAPISLPTRRPNPPPLTAPYPLPTHSYLSPSRPIPFQGRGSPVGWQRQLLRAQRRASRALLLE